MDDQYQGGLDDDGGRPGNIIAVAGTIGILGGSGPMGFLGDTMVAVTSILIIPMFIWFGAILAKRSLSSGRLVQALGVSGALVKLATSILLIGGVLPYERTVVGEEVSNILVGVAILLYFLRFESEGQLKRSYMVLSIVLAVMFVSSLIAIIFGDRAFTEIIDGTVPLSEANPFIVLFLFAASPIQLLGYPIWLISTGRVFLKNAVGAGDKTVFTAELKMPSFVSPCLSCELSGSCRWKKGLTLWFRTGQWLFAGARTISCTTGCAGSSSAIAHGWMLCGTLSAN